MADNKFLTQLSHNLLEILDDEEYYDITIEVGNDPYVQTFRAHMVILNYRSPYLKRTLSTNKKKSDVNLTHIKLPNILPEIFQKILRYIYGGELSLKEYDTSDIVKILIAASELGLQELILHLQSFLINNETNWIEQNFNMIYKMSFKIGSFSELQNFCKELMFKQPEKIFNSSDFTSIPEKALISLIEQDNLEMSDVQIWNHVLKWGIAQNPELSSDLSSYSNDDYNILKKTLQQCIPLIKLQNLSSKEFLENIFPYKKILPEELYDDLLKIFLNIDFRPSTKETKETKKAEEVKETMEIEETKEIKEISSNKNIDSKIITNQHVELISKWIDRLENTDKLKNIYGFKLLLRGSRDGFSPEKFHKICNNESHTIAVIKVRKSNEILGGYNPIKWESRACTTSYSEYSKTEDSFIFSFKNKNDIKNHILSRVKDAKHAIDNYYMCGPSFGRYDLKIRGGNNRDFVQYASFCQQLSYEKQIRNTKDNFSVEEYEIFQIIDI
ncbi:hypothetical protein RclHR1_00280024 [Rhizophagus clarus]|uniref:Carbohydrate-binding module family 13 protein n=1 Tax=Rhizophagus clarus TaxID=94130 RepID=A0A2Z6R6Z1_9GLOM|nr:hypothetical protein RclHR1_00280024 [Rhizophagus clarus]GES83745.1 carbohydrate-binding module family 13 protein [Rhizophagus clarus]